MADHLFISYARENRDVAEAVCTALEARQLTTWIDYRDVEIGDNYARAIGGAIREAAALVVILTEHSGESLHVEREVSAAGRRDIPVFVYREAEIPNPDTFEYYARLVLPVHPDMSREERVAELAAAVVGHTSAVGSPVRTANVGGARRTHPHEESKPLDRIETTIRRVLSRSIQRALVGAICVFALCLLVDFVAYQEEWVAYDQKFLAAFEDVDIEDYIAASTMFYAATWLVLLFVLPVWAFGLSLAHALADRAEPETIDAPFFRLRALSHPAARVRALVRNAGDIVVSRPALASWWALLLVSVVLLAAGLTLAASSDTVPAMIILGLLAGAQTTALFGCVQLLRVVRAVGRSEPAVTHTPAASLDRVRS